MGALEARIVRERDFGTWRPGPRHPTAAARRTRPADRARG
jgi:hypothetical protein